MKDKYVHFDGKVLVEGKAHVALVDGPPEVLYAIERAMNFAGKARLRAWMRDAALIREYETTTKLIPQLAEEYGIAVPNVYNTLRRAGYEFKGGRG